MPESCKRNSLEMAEKVTKKQNYELQIQSQQAYYETASKWQKTWRKNKITNYKYSRNRLNTKQPRNGRKSDEKTKLQITITVATGLTRNSLEMAEKVTKKQNYKLQIQSQQAKLETASILQKKWKKNKIQNFELSPNRLNSK